MKPIPFNELNILPYFTKPLEDELFSSWLIRCSIKHNSNIQTFSKNLFKSNNIWNRDIDKSINLDWLKYFCEINYTDFDTGLKSTFHSYENILYEKLIINTRNPWIIPLGVYHRKRKRFSLQFCPLCLQSSNPYYKLYWRISLFVCCPICETILHDRCPICLSPIAPHRIFIGNKSESITKKINQCSICDFDLSKSQIMKPDKEVLDFTKTILQRIKLAQLNQYVVNEDLMFFNGLNSIIWWLLPKKPKSIMISDELFKTSIINVPYSNFNKNDSFGTLDVLFRYKIVYNLSLVIKRWPEMLIKTSNSHKINFHEFNTYGAHEMPYWIFNVLKSIN